MTTLDVPATLDTTVVAQRLLTALRSTLFGSRLTITPRRISQIASEIAADFCHYTSGTGNADATRTFGRRLANDGLGHSAVLALVSALHEVAWQHHQSEATAAPISVSYNGALLAGYMEERETYLLKEQEISRLALERVRTQQTH